MKYTVAFVGNPNVGKSAWINALSNADFKVGNWPGVTVEKKEAFVTWGEHTYHFIDLPGTYSLEESNNEEHITARYLKEENVDLIVNVVDATNLSRNLLLTLFLRDLQKPMLMIFNFMDEVEKYHIHIDTQKLARRLQIPIFPYSAFDKEHYHVVKEGIEKQVQNKVFYYPLYNQEDNEVYVDIYNYIEQHLPAHMDSSEEYIHTLCVRYLNEDSLVLRQLTSAGQDMEHLQQLRRGLDKETLLQHRYNIIASFMKYVEEDPKQRYKRSSKIDAYALHKYWGLPIFFLLFSILLLFVFQASAPFNDFIDFFIHDMLTKYVQVLIAWAPDVVQQLILQGVIAGVGGVLVFIPLMAFLYFVLALLEESGYMSRIAFLLDRMMSTFHLSGKSFVSLLLGFGCNVPAIYATRTLDNDRQRKLTALLIPFMSCGARLPVYVLFAAAFFPDKAALMMLSVYGIGICLALVFALLFSRNKQLKDDDLFVLELPPYRLPSMHVVFHKVKEEVRGYVKKATGIVLFAMIILWGFSYFPNGTIEDSYIAQFSKTTAPIFEPLGFGNRWECVASLPGGIIAKETIVGFLDTVLSDTKVNEIAVIDPMEDGKEIAYQAIDACKKSVTSLFRVKVNLKAESQPQVAHIRSLWSDKKAPLRAFSFMVYVLLSIPCIMTLQALYHEYGKRLLCVSLISMLVLPYLISFCIFQFFSMFM